MTRGEEEEGETGEARSFELTCSKQQRAQRSLPLACPVSQAMEAGFRRGGNGGGGGGKNVGYRFRNGIN